MWKIDKKDKCMYTYKNIMFPIVGLFAERRGRGIVKENDSE
jgi:hypothetical protein